MYLPKDMKIHHAALKIYFDILSKTCAIEKNKINMLLKFLNISLDKNNFFIIQNCSKHRIFKT